MSRRPLALPLALALLLASGCLGGRPGPGTDGPGPAESLRYPVLLVATTHDEPEPQRGNLLVAWDEAGFGISAPGEQGMTALTYVEGGEAYTSQASRGWVRQDRMEGLAWGGLSERTLLWDLRALAALPEMGTRVGQEGAWTNLTGSGTIRSGTYEWKVTFSISALDGTVQSATVTSPDARESPHTFATTTLSFPFPLERPAPALSPEEVAQGEARAHAGHGELILLLHEYRRSHGNTLPERVDPQSLQVEMVASGRSWPTNPFTGQPMQARDASGDFTWVRCDLQSGRFVGLGWDGPLQGESFGRGCSG
jgi:hypothetical protein